MTAAPTLTRLSSTGLRQRLTLSTPPAHWPELHRRLQAEPTVWSALRDPDLFDACSRTFAALSDWRPGRIGLLALHLRFPESAVGDPRGWLAGAGQSHVKQAVKQALTTEPTLANATLLAASLLTARTDWPTHLRNLPRTAETWSLALVCLPALLDDPLPLLSALLPIDPALAVRVGLANAAPDDLLDWLLAALTSASHIVWLRTSAALQQQGYAELAVALAEHTTRRHTVPTPPDHPDDLATLLQATYLYTEHALQTALANHPDTPDRLSAALAQAQQLTMALATELGEAALQHGDPVSALTAFQEAARFASGPTRLDAPMARALLALDRPEEALRELRDDTPPTPEENLLKVHACIALADYDSARQAALAALSQPANPTTDLELAGLLHQLDLPTEARIALGRTPCTTAEAAAEFIQQAELCAAQGDLAGALALALPAALTQPDNLPARRLVARALIADDQPAAALTHWQALTGHPRATAADWLGLAETALALDERLLVRSAAEKTLQLSNAPEIFARAQACWAHVLLADDQPDAALQRVQRALAAAPHLYQVWRVKARYHAAQHDAQQALNALESGLQTLPNDLPRHERAAFLSELAAARAAAQQPDRAVEAYHQALDLDPQRPADRSALAELHLQQARPDDALAALTPVLATPAATVATFELLAHIQQARAAADDAIDAWQQAIERADDTQRPRLHHALGLYAAEHGRREVARPVLEALVDSDSADSEVHFALGQLYERDGDPARALAHYRRALQARPDLSLGLIRIGVCALALGDPQAAIAALTQVARQHPNDPERLRTLADAYAQAKLHREAIAIYQQLLTLTPDDVSLPAAIAACARQQGDDNTAQQVLEQAAAKQPNAAPLWQALGDLHASRQQWHDARTAYSKAVAQRPDDLALGMALGEAEWHSADLPAAARTFEHVTQRQPDNAAAFLKLGQVLLAGNGLSQAVRALKQAARLAPGDPTPHWLLGDAHCRNGHVADALAAWRTAYQHQPRPALEHALAFARLLIDNELWDEAHTVLTAQAAHHPTNADLQRLAITAARRHGDMLHAANITAHLLTLPDATAEDAYNAGQFYLQHGQGAAALAAFERACQQQPDNLRACAAAARAALLCGQHDTAQTYIQHALASADLAPDLLADIFPVLIALGDVEQVKQVSEAAIEQQPGSAAAHLALAQAYILQAEAELPARLAKQIGPHAPADLNALRSVIQMALKNATQFGADPALLRHWAGRAQALFSPPQKALSALKQALAEQPTPELHRALASAHRRTGNLDAARTAIRAALQAAPLDPHTLLELALIHQAENDPQGMVAALQQVTQHAPQLAAGHYLLASAWQQAGNIRPALDALLTAVGLDPDEPNWHFELAQLYEASAEPMLALRHYQQAITLAGYYQLPDSECARWHAAFAACSLGQNDLRAALSHYEEALDLDPTQGCWWLAYGRLCRQLNNPGMAAEALTYAAERLNQVDVVLEAADAYLQIDNLNAARPLLTRILAEQPHHPPALMLLADLFTRQGDLDNAIHTYQLAARHSDDPAPALLALANLHLLQRQPEAALDALSGLHGHTLALPAEAALRARALAALQRFPEADAALHQAVRLDPTNAVYLVQLGELNFQRGQLDKALQFLYKALDLEPLPQASYLLARVFYDRRQFDRAQDAINRALDLDPMQADYHFLHGMIQKAFKNPDGALAAFSRALELNPQHVEAQRQRTLLTGQLMLTQPGRRR